MPKLYQHPDKFVELEFINAYNQLKKGVGGPGPPGPRGQQGQNGLNGQSAIQTLIKVFATSGALGTIPAPAILMDVWGIYYSGSAGSTDFILRENGSIILTTTISLTLFPTRFWPLAASYGTLFGKLISVDADLDFETTRSGVMVVCANYLPIANFP